MRLILVKLGGSLITDKSGAEALRPGRLRRLAAELRDVPRGTRLIVGHGGGSYGHRAAAKHGLNRGPVPAAGLRGVAETQDRAAALHREVIGALLAAGHSPFSLAPSSFVVSRAGRPVSCAPKPLERALGAGLLPVVFGDVVLDETWTASICSTEAVFLAIVPRLLRRGYIIPRVLWIGETRGILDPTGKTYGRLTRRDLPGLLRELGGAAGPDVTGGIALRVRAARRLADIGVGSWIVDGREPGALRRALRGGAVRGTRIEG